MSTPGIHHITAIASDPQRNLDFYVRGLGLRLVKRTVNFDDPTTYHLYFGDRTGRPGTLLTFFPWVGMRPGRAGPPQIVTASFAVSRDGLDFWRDHLRAMEIPFASFTRFNESGLRLHDPDGLAIELVGTEVGGPPDPWQASSVPRAAALRGFHGATIAVPRIPPTVEFLTAVLGLRRGDAEAGRQRFTAPGDLATVVDLVEEADALPGLAGAGTVHHLAWRAPGPEDQEDFRASLRNRGVAVTPVIDRQYFKSIYFREPAGVLFEIATDDPGFQLDEPLESLGETLRLPPQYEGARASIEALLPPLRTNLNAKTG